MVLCRGSLSRDKSTEPCPSKAIVTVTTATSVSLTGSVWRWAVFKGARCERDSLGTIPGSICDPVSGQCLRRPHQQGRRCEQCQPGRRPAPFQCSDYRGPLCFWVQLLESVPPAAAYGILTELFDLLETVLCVQLLFVGEQELLPDPSISYLHLGAFFKN